MKWMVVGAGKGLGRAFVEGLCDAGDSVVGISRSRPQALHLPDGVALDWINVDMSQPTAAIHTIEQQAPEQLDVLIYNLGIWEEAAFTEDYRFLDDDDAHIIAMVNTNITSAILLLKRLMPRLLTSARPQVILTGSTSGLRQSGRPEVTFNASKFALAGIADALRESFRAQALAVTCLQLGYLNTEDTLATPLAEVLRRDDGDLIPVHDVVQVVRSITRLSGASYVRELVLPSIRDARF